MSYIKSVNSSNDNNNSGNNSAKLSDFTSNIESSTKKAKEGPTIDTSITANQYNHSTEDYNKNLASMIYEASAAYPPTHPAYRTNFNAPLLPNSSSFSPSYLLDISQFASQVSPSYHELSLACHHAFYENSPSNPSLMNTTTTTTTTNTTTTTPAFPSITNPIIDIQLPNPIELTKMSVTGPITRSMTRTPTTTDNLLDDKFILPTESELAFQTELVKYLRTKLNSSEFSVNKRSDQSNSDIYIQVYDDANTEEGKKITLFESIIEVKKKLQTDVKQDIKDEYKKNLNQLVRYAYHYHKDTSQQKFKSFFGLHLLWYFDALVLVGTFTDEGDSMLRFCAIASVIFKENSTFKEANKLLDIYLRGLLYIRNNYAKYGYHRYTNSVPLRSNVLLFQHETQKKYYTVKLFDQKHREELKEHLDIKDVSLGMMNVPVVDSKGKVKVEDEPISTFIRKPNVDCYKLLNRSYLLVNLYNDDSDNCALVTEYHTGRMFPKNLGQMTKILNQLTILHNNNWVHGDVRLENLVFSYDGNDAWLIDFDLAANEGIPYPFGYNHTLAH